MYKRALSGLLAINLIFLIGVLSLCRMEEICRKLQQTVSEVHMEESLLADKESIMMGIASRTSSGQRVVDCSELQRESKYQLEQADLEVLLRIVEAEAGCEDEDGKLLVANVILNRLNSEKFPDSITEIVFQRENGVSQFSPIADGSYYKVSVSEETAEAVGRALAGEDISRGALYFAARKYADSESAEQENRTADKTFDLQESTYWSTMKGSPYPHLLVIDLGSEQTLTGIDYLPRAEQGAPGGLKDYKIFLLP